MDICIGADNSAQGFADGAFAGGVVARQHGDPVHSHLGGFDFSDVLDIKLHSNLLNLRKTRGIC